MRLARRLFEDLPPRGRVTVGVLSLALLAAPLVVGSYPLSILILVLYFAFIGQAWNVMMGFAGQLSLGHALYLGLGGYTAAALAFHFGISPWIGMIAGVAVAMLAGGVVGFLGFRFSLAGVYFALLTIAFAEFTRILFDHFPWVGGSAGLFLRVDGEPSLWHLRGGTTLFYYVILGLAAAALVVCRLLLTSRLGYYWLAIREDPEAARASGVDVFRCKMAAVLISSGMAAVGGAWAAFYYKNLFPETAFAMGRSIETILAPIIGGLGTLFGPLVGAAILVALGDLFTVATEKIGQAWGIKTNGLKQIFYGLALLAIVAFRREGVWPWVADRLGLGRRRDGDR
ncbi:MAG: branched-chain amino acid ABC transporter permease [Rhodospirillales bacterium]|nr:branched-chain amino acid ABC transporter permease [Rhodospirillales bacterium]